MASRSGYPLSLFVVEPENDLQCQICLGVARDPLQHEKCGRVFCKWCILQHGMDEPCPNCRSVSRYYEDKRGERAIRALKVRCSKCDWEGPLKSLDKHEDTCFNVQCPECKETMLRCMKRKHLEEECEEVELPCKYEALGCDKLLKREDRSSHEQNDKGHLTIALKTISTMNKKASTLAKTSRSIYKFYVHKFRQRKACSLLKSSPFYVTPTGYEMKIILGCKGRGNRTGTHVSVGILAWGRDRRFEPIIGSVTITLLNQLEDDNHHTKTLTLAKEDNMKKFDEKWCNDFIPHAKLN